MSEMNYKYLVAISESTEAQDVEAILNEKAQEGWELFMLHEVDSHAGKIQYNCIFHKIDDEFSTKKGENIEITDITDFKKQIEKIYNAKDNYNEYLELQQKIIYTQKQIKETKAALEASSNDNERSVLNDKIQEDITYLDKLNKQLSKSSDSTSFYNNLKSDKITVYLSDELICLTESDSKDNLVARNIKLRQDISSKLGYIIPNIRYSDSIELEPYQFRIDIREVPSILGFVYPEYRMFYKGQSNITRKPKNAITAIDPIYLLDVYWLNDQNTANFWDQGLSASDIIAQCLSYTAIKSCYELLNYNDMNNFIDIVRNDNIDLVENLIPEIISVGDLRYILANLIREMVPIKDITFIFEKIMDCYNYAVERDLLLEKVRLLLKRQICFSKVDSNNTLFAIVIAESLDKIFNEKMVTPETAQVFIDISEDEANQLMASAVKLIEKASTKIENTVILCSSNIRLALFNLFEEFIPGISVLSHEEIASDIELKEIGVLERKHVLLPKKKPTSNDI